MHKYSTEILGNGLASILDRESGLRGLYCVDSGKHHAGDLRLPTGTAHSMIQSALFNKYCK